MKNALAIVTLSALLSACASGSQPGTTQAGQKADPTANTAAAETASVKPASLAAASAPTPAPASTASSTTVVAPVTDDSMVPRKAQVRPRVGSSAIMPAPETPLASVLSEDVLFRYLSAEIADQRGNWQAAYINMLAIAQQTRDPRLARRAAEIALNAKQTGEALSAVRLWRELAPDSDEATQYYLGFLILGDDLSEARPILEKRLADLRPAARGPALLQLQRLLARAKNREAAFQLLEHAAAPYNDLPEAHLALAQAAYTYNDSKRAVAEAETALKIAPASDLAALTLAQVLPDKEASARSLAAFIEKNPKSREVRLAYARMLVEQKNYDGARVEFKKLLAEQPEDLTVLYALGLLGTQNSDWAEAETYLTKFVEMLAKQPEDERDPTQALMILAQIAEERNDTATALKWLGQVDTDVPQAYLNAQIRRAQIIARAGDLPGGRKIIADFKADGQDEQIQLILADAMLLRSAGRTDEALAVLANSLQRFPDNTDLLYDHAMAAEKLGKLDVMENSLRQIMKLAPQNQNAYNALGYSLAERNLRLEEAFTLIQKALQLAPQDPFIMDSMGWVQFRLGRLKEAEALLRQAYTLRPDPEIGVHLGEVLWAIGQKDDARKLWRDANTRDPKNDTLKSTLARLQVTL